MINEKNLIHRMRVNGASNSLEAIDFYFRRGENMAVYDMINISYVRDVLGMAEFHRLFGHVGYRNDILGGKK